jgi:uncharacterized protein YjbI with pentapeptide repeats
MLALALAITTAVTLLGLHFLHVQHFKPEHQLSAATLFNLLKVAFAVAAGIGAVVALVTAYRRQRIAEFADQRHELAEQREQTRLLNERFTTAAGQLGHDNPAIRLAGVYAMAGLADDWPQQRQTCVDVLCAYLRMPYQPDPGDDAPTAERLALRASGEVRHTLIRIITAHLQPDDQRAPTTARWHGLNLDFTGVVFDGGDFRGARFTGGHINFNGAWFTGGRVNFIGAWFTGATVSFDGAQFTGGQVSFSGARFTGGQVSFSFAQFTGSQVDFDDAQFTGATVGFSGARFTGSEVDFSGASFSAGRVTFILVKFTGGDVHLSNASFTGGHVSFGSARFTGGHVDFSNSRFAGARVEFDHASFTSAGVDFSDADFTGGLVDFSEPDDWSSPPQFPDWGNNPPQPVRLPASSPAP